MSTEILEVIEQERQKLLAVIDSCNARVDKLLAARDALDGYDLGAITSTVSLDGRDLADRVAEASAPASPAGAAKAPAKAKPKAPATPAAKSPRAGAATRAAASRLKVMQAMAGHGRCRMDDIVKRSGLNIDTVRIQLRQMGETGDVERTGGGPLTRYEFRADGPPPASEPPGLAASEPESDVGVLERNTLRIVDQNPGKLTVDRIAQAVGVHPEHVEPVVLALTRARKLHRRIDLTYELGDAA